MTRRPVCWVFTMLFQRRVQPQVLSFNILRSSSPTHSPPFTSQVRAPGQEAERKVVSRAFQCIFYVHPHSCTEENSVDRRASPLTGAGPGGFPQGLQDRDGKADFVRFHRGKGWMTKLGRQRPAGHSPRAQTCKRHLVTGCVSRWKERYLPESAPD